MKYVYGLIFRYLLIFIPLSLFYLILTPITIYGVYFLLYPLDPIIVGNILSVNGIPFTFIDACIAIYAYWLLLFLALTTKDV